MTRAIRIHDDRDNLPAVARARFGASLPSGGDH
jgi:hypothetical protein